MTDKTSTLARVIGFLLLLQITGLIVPFAMLHPITGAHLAYLRDAAPAADQIKTAAILLLTNCAITVAISILAWPIIRRYSEVAGLLLVALSVVMLCLQIVDNSHILSMVAMSQQSNGTTSPSIELQATLLATTRKWTHYGELLAIDAWILCFYACLFRFSIVPRALAIFALITLFCHFFAITLPLWMGWTSITPLGAVMALSHVLVALWLMVKACPRPRAAPVPAT